MSVLSQIAVAIIIEPANAAQHREFSFIDDLNTDFRAWSGTRFGIRFNRQTSKTEEAAPTRLIASAMKRPRSWSSISCGSRATTKNIIAARSKVAWRIKAAGFLRSAQIPAGIENMIAGSNSKIEDRPRSSPFGPNKIISENKLKMLSLSAVCDSNWAATIALESFFACSEPPNDVSAPFGGNGAGCGDVNGKLLFPLQSDCI